MKKNPNFDVAILDKVNAAQAAVREANAPMKMQAEIATDVKPDQAFDQYGRTTITIDGKTVRATLKKDVSPTAQAYRAELYVAVRPFEVQGNKFPVGYPSVKLS